MVWAFLSRLTGRGERWYCPHCGSRNEYSEENEWCNWCDQAKQPDRNEEDF